MLKIRNIICLFFAAVATSMLVGCFNDDDIAPCPDASGDTVRLRLTATAPVAANIAMRGASQTKAPVTEPGIDGENIRNWFVVFAQGNVIKKIITSGDDRSEKIDGETTQGMSYISKRDLPDGQYTVYSFANLDLSAVGLNKESTTLPINFATQTYTINGNQDALSTGFPAGIPMSNVETVTVSSATHDIDLHVIRMVAKIRVVVSNPTTEDITLNSISLTSITNNVNNNIMLLPGAINDENTGARTPNINPAVDNANNKITYPYTVPEADKVVPQGGSKTYEFYVNESETLPKSDVDSPHFILTLTTNQGNTSINSDATTQRYAFLNWNTIARNEIHELPVSLQRFTIGFTVRAYTAIGVAPTVDESDITTINLGLYGHYDILPVVRDLFSGNAYYRDPSGNTRQADNTSIVTNGIQISSFGLELESDNVTCKLFDYDGWTSNDAADVDASGNKNVYLPYVYWNNMASQPRMECEVGNYTGWAIYTVNAGGTDENGTTFSILRRVRIQNTYLDLSRLAKRRHGYTPFPKNLSTH